MGGVGLSPIHIDQVAFGGDQVTRMDSDTLSIKLEKLLQPLIIYPIEGGNYFKAQGESCNGLSPRGNIFTWVRGKT